jgi:hypothetical protein
METKKAKQLDSGDEIRFDQNGVDKTGTVEAVHPLLGTDSTVKVHLSTGPRYGQRLRVRFDEDDEVELG